MEIKEKITQINRKKRIILIFIILLMITIFIGITFATFNDNAKSTSSEISEDNKKEIPNVSMENTKFNLSETELTKNNVIITISSKLEDYDLFYYIEPTQELEDKEMEEVQPIKEEENEINTIENIENYILYQDKIEIETNSKIYFKYKLNEEYSENPYVLEINNINKEEVMEEELENEGATEEELQKGKLATTDKTAKYYVIVNYSSNVVTVYGKDANNEYTVPVKAMVCSTGVDTPRSGVYKLTTTRYRWRALFGGVYGQYAVKIVGNILFHSVPYLSTDNSTLEYWEYDKLGTAASAGCVRLTVTDALWIYNNCGSGTQVEFSSNSSNPLGKPTARKISSYQDLRGYDPTDPASNNPWRNAKLSNNTTAPTPNHSEKDDNSKKTETGESSSNSAQTDKVNTNNNTNSNANKTNTENKNSDNKINVENKNSDNTLNHMNKTNTAK